MCLQRQLQPEEGHTESHWAWMGVPAAEGRQSTLTSHSCWWAAETDAGTLASSALEKEHNTITNPAAQVLMCQRFLSETLKNRWQNKDSTSVKSMLSLYARDTFLCAINIDVTPYG